MTSIVFVVRTAYFMPVDVAFDTWNIDCCGRCSSPLLPSLYLHTRGRLALDCLSCGLLSVVDRDQTS